MFVDLGRMIGGPDDGDGIVGAMLGLISGIVPVAGLAGMGAMDGVGGAAEVAAASHASAGAAESFAAGFGRAGAVNTAESFVARNFSHFTDGAFWLDWFAGKAKAAWQSLTPEVKEMALSQGFLLKQLREYREHKGVSDLLAIYEKLGVKLPDEELLQKTRKLLLVLFAPDKKLVTGDALFKEVGGAIERLSDPILRQVYEAAAEFHAGGLNAIIQQAAGKKWPEAATTKSTTALARIITSPEYIKEAETAEHWFHSMGGAKKGALIFAAGAAVCIGVYYVWKSLGTRSHDHPHEQKTLGIHSGGRPHGDRVKSSREYASSQAI